MLYDVIIIGGGPGGITAAIYAVRQRMKTLIITKEYGGQMSKKATEVCNYPGFPKIAGTELIQKFVEHFNSCNQDFAETKFTEIEKIEKIGDNFITTTTEGEKIEGKSVIIATGSNPRSLDVPGEKEFIGRGISYCVTCDGPIFRNKTIAVVGGGNAGFEAALFMLNYTSKIYILEYGPTPKADLENQQDAKKSGKIEIITNAKVKEVKGDKFVKSIVYVDLSDKKEKTIEVQGVFVEIGHQPVTSLAKGVVDFNEKNEIKIEPETFQTKTPGLFAVGDVNEGKYKQIVTAAGEGCKAALAAYEYIKKQK